MRHLDSDPDLRGGLSAGFAKVGAGDTVIDAATMTAVAPYRSTNARSIT
jgi:hypothetical protein